MSALPQEFVAEYQSALEEHLSGAREPGLQRAYELGRRAIESGIGVLEMAALQREALLGVLRRRSGKREIASTVSGAGGFFAESLSPYEMTHRGFREANTALRRVNEMLEEQAKRIAHALHDEAGQLLVSVHLALDEFARPLPASSREGLRDLKTLLGKIEERLRQLSHELRPTILDDLGLFPALEFLARGVSTRSGIHISVEGSTGGRLRPPVETALYRIFQESLNNINRHSQARHAWVRLRREQLMVCLSIRDDGVGFDVPAISAREGERGLGLTGMRERVYSLRGTFEIHTMPGKGTEIVIQIPLEE